MKIHETIQSNLTYIRSLSVTKYNNHRGQRYVHKKFLYKIYIHIKNSLIKRDDGLLEDKEVYVFRFECQEPYSEFQKGINRDKGWNKET